MQVEQSRGRDTVFVNAYIHQWQQGTYPSRRTLPHVALADLQRRKACVCTTYGKKVKLDFMVMNTTTTRQRLYKNRSHNRDCSVGSNTRTPIYSVIDESVIA